MQAPGITKQQWLFPHRLLAKKDRLPLLIRPWALKKGISHLQLTCPCTTSKVCIEPVTLNVETIWVSHSNHFSTFLPDVCKERHVICYTTVGRPCRNEKARVPPTVHKSKDAGPFRMALRRLSLEMLMECPMRSTSSSSKNLGSGVVDLLSFHALKFIIPLKYRRKAQSSRNTESSLCGPQHQILPELCTDPSAGPQLLLAHTYKLKQKNISPSTQQNRQLLYMLLIASPAW